MRLSENITFAETENGGLIFDAVTGKSFAVNRMGLHVWQELASGKGQDAIVRALGMRFPDTEKDRLVADVERFLSELVRRGLLERP